MQGHVRDNVEEGARLFTDRHWGYYGLKSEYMHEVIDHVHEYVRGRVHTNGIENFWSLLKADDRRDVRVHRAVPRHPLSR